MTVMNERGLTLAEILVAVGIIGLGLVGLAVVIPVSTYGVQEGSQLTTATFLAEQMIERARASAWTTAPVVSDCLGVSAGNAAPVPVAPATCVGSAAPTATQFPDEANVAGYTQYSRTVRVASCAPCGGITDPTMRLVTVTVTYTPISARGGATTAKTVQLDWLVSQK